MANMELGVTVTAVGIVKMMVTIAIIQTVVVQMVVRLAGKVLPVAKVFFSLQISILS